MMKFVSRTDYRDQLYVRVDYDELEFYRHCVEMRRSALSRGERTELVKLCDLRIGEIETIIADTKPKRTLRCVS